MDNKKGGKKKTPTTTKLSKPKQELLWTYKRIEVVGIAPNFINNAFQGLLHIHLKGENKI